LQSPAFDFNVFDASPTELIQVAMMVFAKTKEAIDIHITGVLLLPHPCLLWGTLIRDLIQLRVLSNDALALILCAPPP
jgi:hypothetical protein